MKLFLVMAIWVNAAFGDTLENGHFKITSNQESVIKQKLEAYEKGEIHAQDLTENAGAEGCRELIGYYLLHTNDISIKAKIPISRTFAAGEMYPQAIAIAQEYVNVYSNDWTGWKMLGYYYNSINYSNEAINGYSNAVRLGDEESYEPLAGVALKYGRVDVVRGIVPQLLIKKESKGISWDQKINLLTILTAYSMMADNKNVFIQTLKGEDMKLVLKDDTVKKNIISGCAFFDSENTNNDISKIRQALITTDKNNIGN